MTNETRIFEVAVNYISPAGNACTTRIIVPARDEAAATDKAVAIARSKFSPMKVDGGYVRNIERVGS